MRHRKGGTRGEPGRQRGGIGAVQVDVEPALIRFGDVHAAIVVMMVPVFLGVRQNVPELARSGSGERSSPERLAERGQERKEEHQLANHEPILRPHCT